MAGNSPRNLKIQASLTAKSGFIVEGSGKNIELLGGVQAEDYDSNGNSLTLAPDSRFQDGGAPLDDAPLSAKPLANIVFLRILEWREY